MSKRFNCSINGKEEYTSSPTDSTDVERNNQHTLPAITPYEPATTIVDQRKDDRHFPSLTHSSMFLCGEIEGIDESVPTENYQRTFKMDMECLQSSFMNLCFATDYHIPDSRAFRTQITTKSKILWNSDLSQENQSPTMIYQISNPDRSHTSASKDSACSCSTSRIPTKRLCLQNIRVPLSSKSKQTNCSNLGPSTPLSQLAPYQNSLYETGVNSKDDTPMSSKSNTRRAAEVGICSETYGIVTDEDKKRYVEVFEDIKRPPGRMSKRRSSMTSAPDPQRQSNSSSDSHNFLPKRDGSFAISVRQGFLDNSGDRSSETVEYFENLPSINNFKTQSVAGSRKEVSDEEGFASTKIQKNAVRDYFSSFINLNSKLELRSSLSGISEVSSKVSNKDSREYNQHPFKSSGITNAYPRLEDYETDSDHRVNKTGACVWEFPSVSCKVERENSSKLLKKAEILFQTPNSVDNGSDHTPSCGSSVVKFTSLPDISILEESKAKCSGRADGSISSLENNSTKLLFDIAEEDVSKEVTQQFSEMHDVSSFVAPDVYIKKGPSLLVATAKISKSGLKLSSHHIKSSGQSNNSFPFVHQPRKPRSAPNNHSYLTVDTPTYGSRTPTSSAMLSESFQFGLRLTSAMEEKTVSSDSLIGKLTTSSEHMPDWASLCETSARNLYTLYSPKSLGESLSVLDSYLCCSLEVPKRHLHYYEFSPLTNICNFIDRANMSSGSLSNWELTKFAISKPFIKVQKYSTFKNLAKELIKVRSKRSSKVSTIRSLQTSPNNIDQHDGRQNRLSEGQEASLPTRGRPTNIANSANSAKPVSNEGLQSWTKRMQSKSIEYYWDDALENSEMEVLESNAGKTERLVAEKHKCCTCFNICFNRKT